jgi:hypothetical protein
MSDWSGTDRIWRAVLAAPSKLEELFWVKRDQHRVVTFSRNGAKEFDTAAVS